VDIRLSAEQQLLAEATADLAAELTGRWSPGRGPDTVAPPIPDAQARRMIAAAGWTALRLPEADGGSAASCLDVCVAVEQLGRSCVPAPIVGTLLLVEQLRLRGADAKLLEPIAAGDRLASVALTRDLRGFADSADDACAWDCAGADTAIVCGDDAVAFPLTAAPLADLTRCWGGIHAAGDGELSSLSAPQSRDTTDRLNGFALTVLAADLLGVMSAALDASVAHARTRTQFGAPIGSYQAIAHLAAECLVSVEASRSAVWYAAWAVDALYPAESAPIARAAKAFACEAAIEVTQAAIQIHGGMGMTWEAQPHVWLRRAQTDRRVLGDEHAQYAALALAG
jgi:alkylation response protein AidB-like acyl-CoA dehydrogenase